MNSESISSFSEKLLEIIPYIWRTVFKRQSDALGKGVITIPQFMSLDLLNVHGSLKMKDIARALNVSLPAATGLINRLHKLGLIERIHGQKDRRIIYIDLTKKGKKTVDEIGLARRKVIEDIFGELTDDERAQYLGIIKKVKDILISKDHEK